MAIIDINHKDASYSLRDNEWLCDHIDTTTERACCTSSGSSGFIECGCNGLDSISCDNEDCTGLTSNDIEQLSADCGD